MLTDLERRGLAEEMSVQLLQAGSGIGALIYQWIGRHGPRVPSHAMPLVWASNVLRYCERFGWIEDPAPLLVLLRKVAATPTTPFGAQIPAVAARIEAQQPVVFWSGARAWDTCHLSMEMPFLNRDATRVAFEQFDSLLAERPQAARVLVVNGPPGSGKTFTADFLRLLVKLSTAQSNSSWQVLRANPWSGTSSTPKSDLPCALFCWATRVRCRSRMTWYGWMRSSG